MQEDDPGTVGPVESNARPVFPPDYDTGALVATAHSKTAHPTVSRRYARLNPNCVVCGAHNPRGLQLEFRNGPNEVHALWVPTEEWESFEGTVHGGIITTVLDEAMSKAIIARNWEALTVDLRVRFRDRVSPGEALRVRGWVVQKQKRRILTEASLTTNAGTERAHAWATFLAPRS